MTTTMNTLVIMFVILSCVNGIIFKEIPPIGLGTCGNGKPDGTDGQYWTDQIAYNASIEWIRAGGRRIDTAIDYHNQVGIGQALQDIDLPRDEIFITSKIGPLFPFGYQETLDQIDLVLEQLQTDYVDLLLVHWPGDLLEKGQKPSSCYHGDNNWSECRKITWEAMEDILSSGKAHRVGVSNHQINHLEEMKTYANIMPSVNQVEFHPYWKQFELLHYCQSNNITYNSYSPLGAVDYMSFHPERWQKNLLEHPVIVAVSSQHDSKSSAQILLRWQYQLGILINPRSIRPDHMKENLDIFDFELSEDEMKLISAIPNSNKVYPDPATML